MGVEGAIISGVIAASSAAVGITQQRKIAETQEELDAVGKAQQALQNNRAIRQSIAASKIKRAQLLSSGEAQTGNFGGSSSVTGALGSATTQLGSNIGFARSTQAANSALNNQRSIANQAAFRGGLSQTVGALPGQFGFDVRSLVRDAASKPGDPPGRTPAELEFSRLQGRGGRKFGSF